MTTEDRVDRLEAVLAQTNTTLANMHREFSDRIATVAGILQQLAEAQLRMTEAAERTEVRLDRLTESGLKTDQRLERLAERVDRIGVRVDQLAEAQQHTEERLNALIVVVDGVVRKPPQ